MRMWNVPPEVLCDQHLLGEHVEMHMFAGALEKGLVLRGYVEGGLVELDRIAARHRELAREMRRRGMRHRSALVPRRRRPAGRVDVGASLRELARRCPRCRARIATRAGRGQRSS